MTLSNSSANREFRGHWAANVSDDPIGKKHQSVEETGDICPSAPRRAQYSNDSQKVWLRLFTAHASGSKLPQAEAEVNETARQAAGKGVYMESRMDYMDSTSSENYTTRHATAIVLEQEVNISNLAVTPPTTAKAIGS